MASPDSGQLAKLKCLLNNTRPLAAGIVIEFLLVVYMGQGIIDQTQRFVDIDRCLYFAERLSNQRPIKTEGRSVKITAICKPVPR